MPLFSHWIIHLVTEVVFRNVDYAGLENRYTLGLLKLDKPYNMLWSFKTFSEGNVVELLAKSECLFWSFSYPAVCFWEAYCWACMNSWGPGGGREHDPYHTTASKKAPQNRWGELWAHFSKRNRYRQGNVQNASVLRLLVKNFYFGLVAY